MRLPGFLFTILLIFSCQNNPQKATSDNNEKNENLTVNEALRGDVRKIGGSKATEQALIEQALNAMAAGTDPLLGCWVGMFGENKINISITQRNATEAVGFTVCAGNFRPIKGTVKADGENRFLLSMDEPGDNKYDGHFEFAISLGGNEPLLSGTWRPFKTGVVANREYSLTKKLFTNKTDVGTYPQASARELSYEDVENLGSDELRVMRNEIYARHGYSFRDKAMRNVFDALEWYIPMGVDIRHQLTDTEVRNISLIYRYEKYAEENYDDYGR
ncbi:MAG: YARHG domain-containing protein [Bacteroidia bacterium]|jgi:hypothetical protein|nr:YARHG domain-containing protein [Bacteroidia bacterium]